ncbi:MAG TPA: permease prefix domain 1-containing protein [Actinoplanes sp.]|nr:permease prefix domain 1-containing protein [Actinoplanes sp.]
MTGPPALPAEERLTQYLDEIAAALHGPRRRQQRILAELRDGVEQSAHTRTARGATPEQALAAALAEFGHPTDIANAFRPEMAIADARRILAWLLATGPLVGLWWLLILHPQPWHGGPAALITAIPVVPLIAVAISCALATLVTTGRLIRWIPEAAPRTAVTAASSVAAFIVACDVTIIAVGWSAASAEFLGVIAVGASLARIACSISALHSMVTWQHRLNR